ncbi:MAG: RraA family protein [Hyphomicrobiales bacterium]|nr:RraA family protein [Hyphomicrobiales bacterium]
MIEETPPLFFAPRGEKPSAKLIARFRDVPTSFIVDAMGGAGALDWRVRRIAGGAFAGVALTCECAGGDNLAFIAAVAESEGDDVLVAATGGSTSAALTGDLLLHVARNRGVVGFVTDGLVRDAADLEALALPVYAMGVSPNSPSRRGPGTVRADIVCGGRAVRSGDVIAGDRDGVVVVPRAKIEETLAALEGVKKAEAEMLERVRNGARELPLPGVARARKRRRRG